MVMALSASMHACVAAEGGVEDMVENAYVCMYIMLVVSVKVGVRRRFSSSMRGGTHDDLIDWGAVRYVFRRWGKKNEIS